MNDDVIAEAIWRAYAREAVSMRDLIDVVQAKAGSGRKAAKMVGVGETTWRRWKAGNTKPKPENFGHLHWAFREVRADQMPLRPADIEIRTTDRDDPRRNRTITGRQLKMSATGLGRVEDAYRRGDRSAAAAAFTAAIGDSWYRRQLAGRPTAGGYGFILNDMSIG